MASSDVKILPEAVYPGQMIAGKYRVERRLSAGGMGAIWTAEHVQLGMRVAVKVMAPDLAATSDGRARFAREAKAASAIQSPHVVKVYDYGVDAGRPFLVMELLQGEDLGARLRRRGRLPLREAAILATQIGKGLRRAHDAGVVHRDLKPTNVFLSRCDEDEIVQILDFGIAKLLRGEDSGDTTLTGLVLGSMHYMSPEQARGYKGIDHRTDLWSFGVILYRAVAGEVPFGGNETGDVIVKLCTDPIPAVSGLVPELPAEVGRRLDRFFARALARDPAERFQSARDMASAFGELAGLGAELQGMEGPSTAPEAAAHAQEAPTARVDDATPNMALNPPRLALSTEPVAPETRTIPIKAPRARSSRATALWAGGAFLALGAVIAVLALRSNDSQGEAGVATTAAATSVTAAPTAAPSESAAGTAAVSAAAAVLTAQAAGSASASARSGASRPAADKVKRKLGF